MPSRRILLSFTRSLKVRRPSTSAGRPADDRDADLEAKEEERIWLKRQADGELDDQRLTDGLTGEATIYKRRASEKPEPGRPQLKCVTLLRQARARLTRLRQAEADPVRLRRQRINVSVPSGRTPRESLLAGKSHTRSRRRQDRSLECCVMIMEAFARLSRPEKYQWDIVAHCGDSPEITLVESDKLPESASDRFKVIQKMVLTTQYAFAGDYTVLCVGIGFWKDEVLITGVAGSKRQSTKSPRSSPVRPSSRTRCLRRLTPFQTTPSSLQCPTPTLNDTASLPSTSRKP